MKTRQIGHLGIAWKLALALVILAGMSMQVIAQISEIQGDSDFGGDVTGLGILNAAALRQQDITIPNQQFIQFGGHFDIATLDFDELVGPAAGDITTPPSGPFREVAWWDVEIQVTRSPAAADQNQGVMISIDKDVTNNTNRRWQDFHMTVGQGLGPGFVESDEFDFLFFKTDPAPLNEVPITNPPNPVQAFDNPPMLDEPIAPDNLWWFADENDGLGPGETTDFWLGISVPNSLFPPGATNTRITLREHASVPEPSALALVLLCAGVLPIVRRRAR